MRTDVTGQAGRFVIGVTFATADNYFDEFGNY
jgi:hypothetical protein